MNSKISHSPPSRAPSSVGSDSFTSSQGRPDTQRRSSAASNSSRPDGAEIVQGRIALPDEVKRMDEAAAEGHALSKLAKENLELQSRGQKYEDIVGQLKHRLEMENKELKELRTQKATENTDRSDIREHFLNCIEEIRKDIGRRRLATAKQTRASRAFLNRVEVGGSSSKRAPHRQTAGENPDSRPKLSTFTAADKR